MNKIQNKITTSHWYLLRSDSKGSSITSSASSIIMISMLSLYECITHSSSISLEEIKLIAIVIWISTYQKILFENTISKVIQEILSDTKILWVM